MTGVKMENTRNTFTKRMKDKEQREPFRDVLNDKSKKYYEEHKEERRAYSAKRYKENRESILKDRKEKKRMKNKSRNFDENIKKLKTVNTKVNNLNIKCDRMREEIIYMLDNKKTSNAIKLDKRLKDLEKERQTLRSNFWRIKEKLLYEGT